MFKFKNIYDLIDSFHLIMKPIGALPLSKVERSFYEVDDNFGNFSITLSAMILISISTIFSVDYMLEMFDKMQAFLMIFMRLEMVGTSFAVILWSLFRACHFLQTFQTIYKVDEDLKKLGIDPDFKIIDRYARITVSCCISFFTFGTIVTLTDDRNWEFLICEFISFGVSFAILLSQVLLFLFISVILLRRLVLVNRHLRKIVESDENFLYQTQVITDLVQIHLDLNRACGLITSSCSLAILSFYLIGLEALTFVLLAFSNFTFDGFQTDFIFYGSFLITFSVLVAAINENTQNEAKRTHFILSGCKTGHLNENQIKESISPLLQFVHVEFSFKICGLFELTLSTILSNFSAITTAVSFMTFIIGNY